MGGEQAIKAAASQPISAISTLKFNTETRLQNVLERTEETQRRIFESIEAYNERMKTFYAQRAKQIREENTNIAEKKYNEIAGLYLTQTNDPAKMQQGIDQLQSLFRFSYFNNLDKSFDEKLGLAKQQLALTENRLSRLKNGQEDDTRTTSNPMLYSGEFQNLGERDFLS